jgi:5-enolpyruvylshikimate-3-phosphate synthase
MIASLANGPCVLRGFSRSADCMNTVVAMRALGIKIETTRAGNSDRSRQQTPAECA